MTVLKYMQAYYKRRMTNFFPIAIADSMRKTFYIVLTVKDKKEFLHWNKECCENSLITNVTR